MADCKKNCIHWPVCDLAYKLAVVDFDTMHEEYRIDLDNIEDVCKHYLPKIVEAEWIPIEKFVSDWGANIIHHYECSNCKTLEYTNDRKYCSNCGAKMVGRR